MKKIKLFNTFNESFLNQDKKKAIDSIVSYLRKKANIDLYEYEELWHIQKGNLFLTGQLFISLKSGVGVRFNWKEGDIQSEIHSIDVWKDFKFDTNPDYTLEINNLSIINHLPEISNFIKDPRTLVKEEVDVIDDLKAELDSSEKRLKRLKNKTSIDKQMATIQQLKAKIAYAEKSDTDSEKVNQLDDDLNIDIFKSIELYTIQVARGKSNSLIITGDAGVGKCHGKGTKILMYDGSIKNVEDIEVGEFLMGNDSKPRKVLSLGRGKDTIYEIKSKGWDRFTVNSEHILVLRNRKKSSNKPFEISVKDFLQKSKTFQDQSHLIRTSVEFKEKEIKMDPYLMGIWIGYGARNSPHGIETSDDEIVSFLEEKSNDYNLSERNEFLNDLKDYKLYNCVEKFIPNDYLINSTDIRKKLLAGLIDSDGYQFHKSYSIATKWKELANQIVFLSRSLGFKSHISIKIIKGKEYYNVNISGDLSDLPIRLERKKSEKRDQVKNVLNSGFSISEIGYDDYYGFELDGNHLYLLGDFTITHNTQVVKDTLSSLGMEKDKSYYFVTGTVTTAGLYETLFLKRKMLIIFDDCDAVFKDPDSVNMLKGALDTYKTREISKLTKGNTFDSLGMNDYEMEEEFNSTGKVPNKFEFSGQIIFISNLPEEKFDAAILSRSLHVDVTLNKKELFDRMREIMKKLSPDVDEEKKEEALEYLSFVTNNYPTKFDLNIRTLIHSINLRANNEEKIKIGDKEEYVWKLLIKKYLIQKKM